MKRLTPYLIIVFLAIIMGFDTGPGYVNPYKPIFMMRADMESNIKLKGPQTILEPGKIYLKDQWIYIIEKFRGIHVIDNANPEHPANFAFISIDGCIDMAIKNNVLYADNAVDLIAIRFNPEMTEIVPTKRIEDVFPVLLSPEGRGLSWEEQTAKPEDAIVVRWDER